MEQGSKRFKIALNLLVLTALIATVALGWLAGHIIRFSIPELWHPPIDEGIPGEKIGEIPIPPLFTQTGNQYMYQKADEASRPLFDLKDLSTDKPR